MIFVISSWNVFIIMIYFRFIFINVIFRLSSSSSSPSIQTSIIFKFWILFYDVVTLHWTEVHRDVTGFEPQTFGFTVRRISLWCLVAHCLIIFKIIQLLHSHVVILLSYYYYHYYYYYYIIILLLFLCYRINYNQSVINYVALYHFH